MITRRQPSVCSPMQGLPQEALCQVAAYFQVLSEPTRLQILNLLREGERSVGELALLCGSSAANVSRHLAMLTQHGLVNRESRGNSVYYRITDASVYELCDLVCGNIARQFERVAQKQAVFVTPAAPLAKKAEAQKTPGASKAARHSRAGGNP